ncbi:phosphoribosyltransferase [Rhizobium sp. C4]|uniref:phosphoribosyltransferase n=1 Tax=Rhizobium sp. C4 TaxID=1349800 RepID=UPI001E4DA817|nr:phosphoribosyltransferase [Rhizobium sp. C4]MCD2174411.1 phosphoribosyltransferase [Rhizobium sp. C4]
MDHSSQDLQPHEFWQEIVPAGTHDLEPAKGFSNFYPARLPDGSQLRLPIRPLADGEHALASLIINQASFTVVDRLATLLAARVEDMKPEIVVGLPTLGLTLAAATAAKLGHARYVPLGTSRKFWYRDELSIPLSSITSPGHEKRLFIDPRMLPLIEGKRVLLIDDVLSSGASILAALRLLQIVNVKPVAIGAAMLQTRRWEAALGAEMPDMVDRVRGVFETPMLRQGEAGRWF